MTAGNDIDESGETEQSKTMTMDPLLIKILASTTLNNCQL